MIELYNDTCIPCENGIRTLNFEEEEVHLSELTKWEIDREGIHKLVKIFLFDSYINSIEFVNKVVAVSEYEGHHPYIHIYYKKVVIELYTNSIKGLSKYDFMMALNIDNLIE